MTTTPTVKEESLTVLITGAGGAGGMAAIRSLQETTDFEIIGVDMNPKAVGLYAADAGAVVPAATNDEWIDTLCDHVETYDVDVIVPLIDEEVIQVDQLRDAVTDTVIVAPDKSFIDICIDKYRLMSVLKKKEFLSPKHGRLKQHVISNHQPIH
jgi:carbamoyl-phosphate synthase large subunit